MLTHLHSRWFICFPKFRFSDQRKTPQWQTGLCPNKKTAPTDFCLPELVSLSLFFCFFLLLHFTLSDDTLLFIIIFVIIIIKTNQYSILAITYNVKSPSSICSIIVSFIISQFICSSYSCMISSCFCIIFST